MRSTTCAIVAASVVLVGLEGSGAAEEKCLEDAWTAFNASKFEDAIRHASECERQFQAQAERIQKELELKREPPPATAHPTVFDKNTIFARGLLNDVGTALFVKGEAAFKQSQLFPKSVAKYRRMSKDAFKKATKFTYARTWDPRGFFWEPAQVSADRLRVK